MAEIVTDPGLLARLNAPEAPEVVTDPALLSRLNEAPVADPNEVTDPALLARLGTPSGLVQALSDTRGAPKPTGFLSGFTSGMQRANWQEQGSLKAALGLAEYAIDGEGGTQTIAEGTQMANQGAKLYPKGVDKIEDVDSLSDLSTYAGDTFGEGLTRIGYAVGAGGIGTVLGKQVAKRAVSKIGQKVAAKMGVGTALGYGIASETGATTSEIYEATGEVRPELAIPAGVVKGSLDTIMPALLGKASGLFGDEVVSGAMSKLMKTLEGSSKMRVAKAAGVGFAVEGGTEAVQETIDVLARSLSDEEYKFFSSETGSRILNAAVAGGMTGSVVSGGLSTLTGKTAKEEAIPEAELPAVGAPAARGVSETAAVASEVAPLEAAMTEENLLVNSIGTTMQDVTKGVTPGSKAEHEAVGFELLPEPYRAITATKLTDLPSAPIAAAYQTMAQDREAVRTQLKTLDPKFDDPTVVATLKNRMKHLNSTFALIKTAVANPDSQGVPSAIVTTEDAEPLFQDLEYDNFKLMQAGYKLTPYGSDGMLQLQRLGATAAEPGRPVFNFPNDERYKEVLGKIREQDLELEKSGFYTKASHNINLLSSIKGQVDLSALENANNKAERAGIYRKAFGEASVLDSFKAKERDESSKAAALMEGGHVKFNRFMGATYTILQWKQRNPTLLPLSNYVDSLQNEKSNAMKTLNRADENVKKFMILGKDQQDAAHDYLEALAKMLYLSADERARNVVRNPTADEERKLIKGLAFRKNKTPLLRETYQAVKDMRQHQDDEFMSYVQDVVAEAQYLADPKERLAQLKNAQTMVEKYYMRPRFPFTSMGQYVAMVSTKDGQLVTARQTESLDENKRDEKELKLKYPETTHNITVTMIPEEIQKWTALPYLVLRDLGNKGYLRKVSQEQRKLLEFIAQIGPENRRRFISGMNPKKKSVDLQRAYAMWAQNLANANFERRSGPEMQREIEALDYVRRKSVGQDTRNLGLMVQELHKHMDWVINPKPDWHKVKNFAFMMHLAFNVKSALVNTTQVPMVALPYLSARFGDVKAAAAITQAYFDKRTLYIDGKSGPMSDSVSRLLTKGVESGKVDESFASELASVAEGVNLNRIMAGSKYDRFMKELSYYGSYMFSALEKMNRSVVFRSTAQLALADPDNKYLKDLVKQNPRQVKRLITEGFSEAEAAAYLAAIDAIDTTMFSYAKWNRPKFMRGGAQGALLTFQMFSQGMLHFAVHSPGSVRYLLIMMAVAGLYGLPGADDLDQLIQALAQRFAGKDFSPKLEARKLIATYVDPMLRKYNPEHTTAADMLLHGLSSDSFGLAHAAEAIGMPYVPHVNLSQSLSMGRISPLSPELLKPGVDYTRALAETTERAGGAAFGPFFAIIEAARADGGDFKRWEKAMPAALRGFIKAGRWQREGLERNNALGTVIDFNPLDPGHNMEIIAASMGFTPTRLTKKWDQVIATQDAVNYWDYRKAVLLKQMDYAVYMKDADGKADMLKAIKRFNQQLPKEFKTKGITAKTLRASLKERQRRRAEGPPKNDQPAVQYFDKLYKGDNVDD